MSGLSTDELLAGLDPNEELAIFYHPGGSSLKWQWVVQYINTSVHVCLGESRGEYMAHAETLEKAIADLKQAVKADAV